MTLQYPRPTHSLPKFKGLANRNGPVLLVVGDISQYKYMANVFYGGETGAMVALFLAALLGNKFYEYRSLIGIGYR